MRLWSLHPKYLDSAGLVALWREALLAKAVLLGRTKGYRHHPQLERFRSHDSPRRVINGYLREIWIEAQRRGYRFDARKLGPSTRVTSLTLTKGQLEYEWEHLLKKLRKRNPKHFLELSRVKRPRCHGLFKVVRGGVASWEKR